MLALAPLPYGSNIPLAWIGWSAFLGVLALLTVMIPGRTGLQAILPATSVPAVILYLAILITLIVQILPLGPLEFITSGGAAIESRTLSLAPGATQLMLLRWGSYGVLFLLTIHATISETATRFFLWSLLFIILGYAILGIYSLVQGDIILGMPKWTYLGSATSSFVNRNSFATFLAIGTALSAALTLGELRDHAAGRRYTSKTRIGLLAIVMVIIAGTLVATQSRMGMFAGVAGAMAVIVASAVHGRASLVWIAVSVIALFAIVAALILGLGAGLLERVGSVGSSANDRLALYEQVWAMIRERPLAGYGGGAFELAYPLHHLPPVSADLSWDKAHSTYLTLWVELGTVAGTLPMLIFALFNAQAARLVVQRRGSGTAPIAVIGCSTVVALHSLVDFSLEIEANAMLMVALMALVPAAIIRYSNGARG